MNFRHVIKNTGSLTAATMLGKAMSFIVAIMLARYLSPEGLGLYSAAYAFVNIFSYFHELGLSQLMVQEGSRDRAKLPVYYGNALLGKGIAVVVVFIIMLIVLFVCMTWMGFSEDLCAMIVILGVAMGFYNIGQTILNYYQTVEKMTVAAAFLFLQALLIALLVLGVMYVTHQGVVAVTVTHLITYALVTSLLLIAMRKQIRPVVNVSKLPKMVADGLPFGLQRAVNSIIPAVTTFIMLLLLVPESDIGIFRAAQNLVVVLVFLPNTFAYTIYPILFRLGSNNQLRHQTAMEKVFKIMAVVGIPASAFFCLFANEIISLIYGSQYEGSAAIFVVLSWYFALECLSYPLGDVMTTSNRQWQRTVLQGAGLVLLVALTLWAQPRYGMMGSAWAILIIEAFMFLGYYVFIRLKMYPIRIWRQLPPVLIATLVTMGAAYLIRSWHVAFVACVAAMVYLLVLFAIDKELRLLLKRVLQRSPESQPAEGVEAESADAESADAEVADMQTAKPDERNWNPG